MGIDCFNMVLSDAIICHNEGVTSRMKAIKELGFEAGINMRDGLNKIEDQFYKKCGKDKVMKRRYRNKESTSYGRGIAI